MPVYLQNNATCIQCGRALNTGNKFCSRECKSKSQELKVDFVCKGCSKTFKNWPCMKRKANYCSIKCYWDSTRLKRKRKCKICGKYFIAKNSLVAKGFGIYCSRECLHVTYPAQVIKVCPWCHKKYTVCRAWSLKRNFCSKKCQDDSRRDYVTRTCKKCHKEFDLPMSDVKRGRGNFCTYHCYLTYRGPSTLEEKMSKVLNLAHVNFQREVKFKRFHVDFLIEKYKAVVECDGEYWHLMPKIQERDARKEVLLNSLGYKLVRFPGTIISKTSENKLSKMIFKQLNVS
jgi:very-short-patch-repair endonuclease